jgi:ubiquinone/menaquinone biosynthesis C-methylase UbiE
LQNIEDHPYREFERSGWQRAAQGYIGSFEAATALFAPALLEAAEIAAGVKVLDVACGAGSVSGLAASRGAEVTGIDFSPSMLAQARRRHPAIEFREGDAEALPFDDGIFDAVLISFGLHHFPFPSRALLEGARVLRPGGRIAFSTWASPREHVLHRIVTDAVREAGDSSASLPTPPGGVVNETATCVRLLEDAGFQPPSLRAEILKASISVESAARLLEILEAGTVRMAATLRAQTADKRSAIVRAIEKGISPYQEGELFRIPFAAIVASGTR